MAERNKELTSLQTQIAEREKVRPLFERIKVIFKKYGMTVPGIVIATRVTIGSLAPLPVLWKPPAKFWETCLKGIGTKIVFMVPGFIGLIVSFLFKTAGQVVSPLDLGSGSLYGWKVHWKVTLTPCHKQQNHNSYHANKKIALCLIHSSACAKNTAPYIDLWPRDAVNKCLDWMINTWKSRLHQTRGCFWGKPNLTGWKQHHPAWCNWSGFHWLLYCLHLRVYWTLSKQILFSQHPYMPRKGICFPDPCLLRVWSGNHLMAHSELIA